MWDCSHLGWDAWDVSGMSLGFPGFLDGMDRGIREPSTEEHLGHVEDVPGPWDSGMGWTVGLQPSTVGHSGHVRDVPGLPGTLG